MSKETETQRVLAMILEDGWVMLQSTDLCKRPNPFYLKKDGKPTFKVPRPVATWIASCDKIQYQLTPRWKVWRAK